MRSTAEVIEELHGETRFFSEVFLVVGFENTTVFISGYDSKGVQKLNSALNDGGKLLGLIAFQRNGDQLTFYKRAVAESAELPWVVDFLQSLLDYYADLGKKAGVLPADLIESEGRAT